MRNFPIILADLDEVKNTVGNLVMNIVIPTILWAASLILIVVAMITAIKFAVSDSAEEKAKYKKKAFDMIIAIAVMLAASTLVTLCFSVFDIFNFR